MNSNERGNILFLILIAVILFVALSYAVTQSLRGGGKDASEESARSDAAALMNYFVQISTAAQRMMLTGNIRDYELNFYYQTTSRFVFGSNDNPNCTESRCRVFDPAGGGVSGMDAQALNVFRKPGSASTAGIGYGHVPGTRTNAPDIMFSVNGLTKELCLEINRQAGYDGIVYSHGLPGNAATLPYQFAIPMGPITDYGHVMTNLPSALGQSGTFCNCRLSTESACVADAWSYTVTHVIVSR